MVDIKLKAAWRANFLRQIKQGRTVTESARLLGIGRSKLHSEFRRDPTFQQEVEDILGHEVDSIVRATY